MFCFVLFCFVLFCFVLFCFVLFCFVLFCFILFYFILFYFILFYFILFYFILFYFILFYFICYFGSSGGHPHRVTGCGPRLRLQLPRPPRRHVGTLPARADVLLRHDAYRTNTEPLLEGPGLGRFEVADPATSVAVRSGASRGHFRRHQLQHARVHIRRRSGCHHLCRRAGEIFFTFLSRPVCV